MSQEARGKDIRNEARGKRQYEYLIA